jgi:hypothetical protein
LSAGVHHVSHTRLHPFPVALFQWQSSELFP